MEALVYRYKNEDELLKAITLIMDQAHLFAAIPSPIDFSDCFPDEAELSFASESTSTRWKDMAVNCETGVQLKALREAMGFRVSAFAKLWKTTPSSVYAIERSTGQLRMKSRIKLAEIVLARIAEFS